MISKCPSIHCVLLLYILRKWTNCKILLRVALSGCSLASYYQTTVITRLYVTQEQLVKM